MSRFDLSLLRDGMSLKEAGATLGCSPYTAFYHMKALGLATSRQRVSAEKRAAIVAALQTGDQTKREIAVRMGVCRSTVEKIAQQERTPGWKKPRRPTTVGPDGLFSGPWSDGDKRLLRTLWDDLGWSASQIEAAMNRSRNAVIAQARRMGLSSRPSPIVRSG